MPDLTVEPPSPDSKPHVKRQGTIGRMLTPKRKIKVGASAQVPNVVAHIECGSRTVRADVSIFLSVAGQHLVAWAKPIELPVTVNGKQAVLQPGQCNLYKYPKVGFEHLRKNKDVVPSTESQYVLEEMLKAMILTDDEANCIAHRADGAGASPLHGLLVANTTASLHLVIDCYRAKPALIDQVHSGKIFGGENGMHILCVNSRESELCEVIEIAAESLKPEQLQRVFQSQATGIFFSAEPMSFYGSTPVSYAVAFSLQTALSTMLRVSKEHAAMKGIINLNDSRSACKLTGMLPLHVAVANSLTGMVNFLLDLPGMPIEFDDMRARPDAYTGCGSRAQYALLNPLQVACKLGDKKLVQYILRTQAQQQWVWGPVAEYHLDLNGIDSIGDTGNDVMELVSRLDALDQTKEMLLDNFMEGLVHKLFMQKFYKARWFHYILRLIDLLYVGSLYVVLLMMKERPREVLAAETELTRLLPWITIGLIIPLFEEDLRSSLAWWASARGGPRDAEQKALLREGGVRGQFAIIGRDLLMLQRWQRSHGMLTKTIGWACAVVAEFLLISMQAVDAHDSSWDKTQPLARDRLDPLLVPLSIACFLHTSAFFDSFLFVFERVGILYKAVFKMLATDVQSWMVLFLVFLLNYGMVMYFVYPRFAYTEDEYVFEADLLRNHPSTTHWDELRNWTMLPDTMKADTEDVEIADRFMTFTGALQSLVELAFIGEPLDFSLAAFQPDFGEFGARSSAKTINFAAFTLFYLIYIIMSLILLLNLLIAMMGDTYSDAMEHATLGWRVDFARRVLRLELQVLPLHRCGCMSLHCGQKTGKGKSARWVWAFKTYQANAEGGGARGKTSMFDAGIEQEAEEDALDDDGPGLGDANAAPATPAMVRLNSMQGGMKVSKRALLERKATSSNLEKTAGNGKMRVVGSAVAMVAFAPSSASPRDSKPRDNPTEPPDIVEEMLAEG